MKFNGRKLKGPNKQVVVLPRPDEDIVFEIQAVLDYSDFDKLCPTPQPPTETTPGGSNGIRRQNTEDPSYKRELIVHNSQRFNWIMLKSLEATPGLEWEKVDLGNPSTWLLLVDEFKEDGISQAEINYLFGKIMEVNGLNDEILEQARRRFLASKAGIADKS